MMRNRLATFLVGLAIAAILLFSFGRDVMTPAATPLAIVSGSENRALEPLILDWAAQNNLAPTITYLGSVDISREIAKGTEAAYDAVWPANSLWLQLGDTQKVIKHPQSILRSPVVLGLRKPIA